MFDKMRKCLDDFEATVKKNELIKEEESNIRYFYLDFAKAMLSECIDVDKVARAILVEYGLFEDINVKFGK